MSDEDAPSEAPPEERAPRQVSEKQVNFIRSLQTRLGLSEEDLVAVLQEVAGVEVLEDLGARAASDVIDELQVQAKEKGIDLDSGPRASEKQLGFIRSLQTRLGLSEEDLVTVLKEVAGVEVLEDLGTRAASDMIDELQTQAKERGIDTESRALASEKQVNFMRSLKRRAHLTDDEFKDFLEERAGVAEPEQVSKRDASGIIDELLKRANESKKGGGGPAPRARAAAPPPPDDDVPF